MFYLVIITVCIILIVLLYNNHLIYTDIFGKGRIIFTDIEVNAVPNLNLISKLFGSYSKLKNILDRLKSEEIFLIKNTFVDGVKLDYLVYSFILDDKDIIIKKKVSKRLRDKGYELYIDGRKVYCNKELFTEIFEATKQSNLYFTGFKDRILMLVFKAWAHIDKEKLMPELMDRLEEFEVIKNGKIDFISLESLFDFYSAKFSEDNFKKEMKLITKKHLLRVG